MFHEVVIQANISFSLGTIWSEPQWGNVSSSGDSSKYTHTGEPLFPTLALGQGCLTTSVSQWVNVGTKIYQSKFDWFKFNLHLLIYIRCLFGFQAERGQIYGLLGASGCGKTSLLSVVVGRRQLNSGLVQVQPGCCSSESFDWTIFNLRNLRLTHVWVWGLISF